MASWLIKKGVWQRIYNTKAGGIIEPETGNYDDMIRHLVTESGEDAGWVIKNEGTWNNEPYVHTKIFLQGLGIQHKEVIQILGGCVNKCWRLVNRPFQDEYVGDRQWNRSAAQLRFAPSDPTSNLNYPTWLLILNHVGQSLDPVIQSHPWAKLNHILDGFVLSSGVPPIRGRARIEKHYEGTGGPLALRAFAFATEGSIGYIIGGFARQRSEADIGKFTLTLRKASDGRWYIASDMDNGNTRP